MSLLDVDSLSFSLILSKLDAVSCTRLMSTCSSLRAAVLNDARCWSRLCRSDFWTKNGDFSTYLEQAKEFGKYRQHGFARLRRAFSVLDKAFKMVGWALLRPGASEEAISEWEQARGFVFPMQTRCSLRLVNGQSGQYIHHALLGNYSFYDVIIAFSLPALNVMRKKDLLCMVVGNRGGAVTLSPQGQVVYTRFVLANSWAEFVEKIANQIKNKALVVDASRGVFVRGNFLCCSLVYVFVQACDCFLGWEFRVR